jgi:hypothetical protein
VQRERDRIRREEDAERARQREAADERKDFRGEMARRREKADADRRLSDFAPLLKI